MRSSQDKTPYCLGRTPSLPGCGCYRGGRTWTYTASIWPRWSANTSAKRKQTSARYSNAAEESGALLLFDEADELFGKRSEVKDSHDRYVNPERSDVRPHRRAHVQSVGAVGRRRIP
jgi:hypothetical protein